MTMSNEMLTIEVEKTLNELQKKHAEWDKQQRYADTLLYTLLEGCLDFYYFMRTDERYETAFKAVCGFKWNSNTTLATLITKSVFDAKAKKAYAYAKAITAAINNNVGTDGNVGMAQWLKENGGVNGVIREKSGDSKAKAERDYKILVGKNVERFGAKKRYGDIASPELAELMKEECLLLVVPDKENGKLVIKWFSYTDKLRDGMYEELGEVMMERDIYRQKRAEVMDELKKEGDEATEKVLDALNSVKVKVAEAEEKEEALEAA